MCSIPLLLGAFLFLSLFLFLTIPAWRVIYVFPGNLRSSGKLIYIIVAERARLFHDSLSRLRGYRDRRRYGGSQDHRLESHPDARDPEP